MTVQAAKLEMAQAELLGLLSMLHTLLQRVPPTHAQDAATIVSAVTTIIDMALSPEPRSAPATHMATEWAQAAARLNEVLPETSMIAAKIMTQIEIITQ